MKRPKKTLSLKRYTGRKPRKAGELHPRAPGLAGMTRGLTFDELMATRPGAPTPAPPEPELVYRPCPACGEPDGLGAPSGLCRNLCCPSLNGPAP